MLNEQSGDHSRGFACKVAFNALVQLFNLGPGGIETHGDRRLPHTGIGSPGERQ